MAQVSAQMSQDHMATAFHFFISKRGTGAAALEDFFFSEGAAASDISTSGLSFFSSLSAMVDCFEGEFAGNGSK